MNPLRPRRLAFELLEPKASPSSLLLVMAPLDEPAQRLIESEHALYAAPTAAIQDSNAALLRFIAENTRGNSSHGSGIPLPTPEQAATADKMMQCTDSDLRSVLIAEMLEAASTDCHYVGSVIQF